MRTETVQNAVLSSQNTSGAAAHGRTGRELSSAGSSQKTTSARSSGGPNQGYPNAFSTICQAGATGVGKENDHEREREVPDVREAGSVDGVRWVRG